MAHYLRIATPDDAAEILSIYAPYIEGSTVTAEEVVPTESEFKARMESILKDYPWLVCYNEDGEVLGYSYASRHQQRSAYRYSVNLSIYVNPRYHRNHVATELYRCLFELLSYQGYKNAFAAVIIPNPQSAAFHHSLGFRPVAVFSKVTYKLGRWNDMEWFQYVLSERATDPAPILPFQKIAADDAVKKIIDRYNARSEG